MTDPPFDPHGHLTPEALGALHEGRLGSAIEATAQAHLAGCAECRQDLEDFATFELSDSAAARDLPDAAVASAWGRLAAELPSSLARPQQAAAGAAKSAAEGTWRPRARSAVMAAAASVVALVGLLVISAAVRSQRETVWPNVPIVDLDPAPAAQRGPGSREASPAIVCDQGVVLILHSDDERTFERTRLDVRDAGGKTALQRDGLERTASGYYTVALACGDLPTGPLEIVVEGAIRGEGKLTTIETYHVDVRAP